MTSLKEWKVSLWIVCRNGQPYDYAMSRAAAFAAAKRRRSLEPTHFWSVAPSMGTISVRIDP